MSQGSASGGVTVTSLPALVAGTANIGDVDVLTVPAPLSTTGGGTEATALRVTVATDSTGVLSVDDNGSSLTVDAPVGTPAFVRLSDGAAAITTLPVSLASLPALVAGTANIGDVDVLTVPAPLSTTGGGTEATALRVTVATDSTGVLSVDDNGSSLTVDAPVATPVFVRLSDGAAAITTLPVSVASVPSHAVTNAGTFATQVDGSALTALQLIDDPVIADDAAFTIGTSKVMMSGGAVVAHGSNPDAADAGDGAAPLMNRHRVLFTIGGHPNVITTKHTTITTAVTDAAIVTISTGSKIVVTRISATLDSASTVYPSLLVGFGTANTPTTTGVLLAHGGVPAGGGMTVGDGSGILGIGADNEDLRVTTTGNATGNGLQIVVSYYTIET